MTWWLLLRRACTQVGRLTMLCERSLLSTRSQTRRGACTISWSVPFGVRKPGYIPRPTSANRSITRGRRGALSAVGALAPQFRALAPFVKDCRVPIQALLLLNCGGGPRDREAQGHAKATPLRLEIGPEMGRWLVAEGTILVGA